MTDKVWHELAFGFENLGLDTLTIRRRSAEMANFFGIQKWFRQKQWSYKVVKAIIKFSSSDGDATESFILDEPTSQLDPIAAMEFIRILHRLNQELGLTIVLIEHRLEEVLPIADKVIVMDEGSVYMMGLPMNC